MLIHCFWLLHQLFFMTQTCRARDCQLGWKEPSKCHVELPGLPTVIRRGRQLCWSIGDVIHSALTERQEVNLLPILSGKVPWRQTMGNAMLTFWQSCLLTFLVAGFEPQRKFLGKIFQLKGILMAVMLTYLHFSTIWSTVMCFVWRQYGFTFDIKWCQICFSNWLLTSFKFLY